MAGSGRIGGWLAIYPEYFPMVDAIAAARDTWPARNGSLARVTPQTKILRLLGFKPGAAPMYAERTPIASSPSITLKGDLLREIPKLRAYARMLHRKSDRADDLVQETLVKALANIHTFEPGSNLPGWLRTIMRNEFYSEFRKRRHEVEDTEGRYAAMLRVSPSQEGHIHFLDVRAALNQLTTERREALMLIVSGMSYEEAATLCGRAVGTMKSRVSRARARLLELIDDRRPDADGNACGGPISRGRLKGDTAGPALAFA
jgi:RNA polymerase sigma-70 factor (ECF subfamily)